MAVAEEGRVRPRESGAGPALLLVDDDDDLARVFSRAFDRQGFRIHRARDGTEAVALSQGTIRFVSAVVDLVLPGTGGLEVVRAIRRHQPSCRIVAVTGVREPSVERMFREAGADRFLTKPVDLEQLLEAVGPGA